MTDPDLVSRLRARAHDLEGLYGTGSTAPLLTEAADALAACKATSERATGATGATTGESVELLATEHLNLQRLLAETSAAQGKMGRDVAMWRRRCERYETWFALPPDQRHPMGPEFSDPAGTAGNPLSALMDGPDPAPVDLPQRLFGHIAPIEGPPGPDFRSPDDHARADAERIRSPLPPIIGLTGLAKDGPYEHEAAKSAPAVTVAPLKEFGCWQVLVDGAVVPELTVYAFSEARAVERAKAAVARKQET